MATCIWCKGVDVPPSEEHIIPEPLGCPDGFVLARGEVCKSCNNGLSHLDQAVIGEFDLLSFMAGVPRKKNRPPEIRGRGNLIATTERGDKEISINMERTPRPAHDGSTLGAFGKSPRNINAELRQYGTRGKTSFEVPFGQNPKFVRGIVKIAYSSLAYFLGAVTALQETLEPVRAFVRSGEGRRPILLMASSNTEYQNRAWAPYVSEHGHYAVTLRLAMVEFCVDLSPSLTLLPELEEQLKATQAMSGWTVLGRG